MEGLDFSKILKELNKREVIHLRKDSLGLRKVDYIMKINPSKIKQ